jgi:hypothetical protein
MVMEKRLATERVLPRKDEREYYCSNISQTFPFDTPRGKHCLRNTAPVDDSGMKRSREVEFGARKAKRSSAKLNVELSK